MRKHTRIGFNNGIFFISQVKIYIPVIGINDDLDGISDVVKSFVIKTTIRAARIRIHVRGGVGIQYPIELPSGDNQVRIAVIIQKRGN